MDRVMSLGMASAFIALAIAFGLGWWGGYSRSQQWWWNEMIRRRHALYHWEDGKVYWNEDEPPTPRDPAANKARQTLTPAEREMIRGAGGVQ